MDVEGRDADNAGALADHRPLRLGGDAAHFVRGHVKRSTLRLALAIAGLVVGVGAAQAAPNPKAMVLKLTDLPASFSLEKGYYCDNACAAKEGSTPLSRFQALGRITGYAAQYTREALVGAIRIESHASLYKTAKGAHQSWLDSIKKAGNKGGGSPRFKELSLGGRIGHEARYYSTTGTFGGVKATIYVVIWRYGNVKASLVLGGVAGTVEPALGANLARKQQIRIKRPRAR